MLSTKRVVYVARRLDALGRLGTELEDCNRRSRRDGTKLEVQIDDLGLELVHEVEPASVLRQLERAYVSMVLVDMRRGEGAPAFDVRARDTLELLHQLDDTSDVEARYGFHRIAVLVSDEDGAALDPLLLELGARGVRLVLRERADERGFAARALSEACATIRARKVDKTSLCLSGGGTTGIYFELGALKCLQDSLPVGALNDFDMYFGISAGAVVGSALAVGYSVDELMAAVAGASGTRLPPFDLDLVRFANVNFKGTIERWASAAREFGRILPKLAAKRSLPSRDEFAQSYLDLLRPPFHAAALQDYLREVFEQAGASNRFSDLDRELYVGASDLDTRKHVLFGTDEAPDVSISEAVQASVSFNPVFAPVRLRGRDYEDGAVTRTSNFVEALRRGASLLLIVDPFVPMVSRRAGAHARHGALYQMDQTIRTMSFTRFESTRNAVLRRHPEVSAYTFVPSNRQRRLLTGRPMDHRDYAAIWRGAYQSTLARMERLEPKLAGDLRAHGLELNLDRPRRIASHLARVTNPGLDDFWPDGDVQIYRPRLALDRSAPPSSARLAG